MVTTTAPPPFLARISAGTEDPRRLPPSALLQRLRRGDSNCENQPSCCLAGPGGSARPALKRVRRRKGKIRPGPAGLLPSRYQQYQQHRAGLGRRTPLGTDLVTDAPPEEPPAPAPSRPAPGKPLRKEVKPRLRYFSSLQPAPGARRASRRFPLSFGLGGGEGTASGAPPQSGEGGPGGGAAEFPLRSDGAGRG